MYHATCGVPCHLVNTHLCVRRKHHKPSCSTPIGSPFFEQCRVLKKPARGCLHRVCGTSVPCVQNLLLQCSRLRVDLDSDLRAVFESAGTRLHSEVSFTPAGISSLPFPDASFDVIYCISVLEHTHNYPDIIREFRRLLTPGGRLIVTFDISLDGDRDISPPAADALLRELSCVFPDQSQSLRTVAESIENTDILTTHEIAKKGVELLPWRSPLIPVVSSIRRGRLPRRWLSFPLLSCYCASYNA